MATFHCWLADVSVKERLLTTVHSLLQTAGVHKADVSLTAVDNCCCCGGCYSDRCYGDWQVSHHPPTAAMFTEGHQWQSWQEFTMASKFRGKYLQIIPLGKYPSSSIDHVLLE